MSLYFDDLKGNCKWYNKCSGLFSIFDFEKKYLWMLKYKRKRQAKYAIITVAASEYNESDKKISTPGEVRRE
ncbi:MAG: hypothetical protein H0W19_06715 [Nitrosopumilus sp.]|nr:hypothetical protein [Nitrosopumilus sp.]